MLMEREIKKPSIQKLEVVPVENLAFPRQNANPTSNKPAIIKINQFILYCRYSAIYPALLKPAQLHHEHNLSRLFYETHIC